MHLCLGILRRGHIGKRLGLGFGVGINGGRGVVHDLYSGVYEETQILSDIGSTIWSEDKGGGPRPFVQTHLHRATVREFQNQRSCKLGLNVERNWIRLHSKATPAAGPLCV